MSQGPPLLRLFFDTDAILAGSASTRGAAHLLLRLAELGLVEGVTCAYVRAEAVRNMERKLPRARPLLEVLLDQALTVIADAESEGSEDDPGVHPKDLVVWRAFRRSGARCLVTFNPRDYPAGAGGQTPGAVLAEIRGALGQIAAGEAPD